MHKKNARTVLVGLLVFWGILFVWSINGSAQNTTGGNSKTHRVVVTPVIDGASPGAGVTTSPKKPAGATGDQDPSGGQNSTGNPKMIIPKKTPQASPEIDSAE